MIFDWTDIGWANEEKGGERYVTFYGYRLEHLSDIAWALQTAELTPQDVERFLKDYGLMYEKAKEVAFKEVEQAFMRSVEQVKERIG